MKQKKKLNLSGTFAIVLALLVLLIFIPINLIVSYFDKGFDMTPSKKYTLDDKTVDLINSNSDKTIEIYFLYKLEELTRSDANELLPLYHTLTQLKEFDNISFKSFDPNENAALTQSLDPNGTLSPQEGDIIVKCNGISKKVSHSKIFQENTKGVREYAGEQLIDSAIAICASGQLPGIYFLTGHGEAPIEDHYSLFVTKMKENDYSVDELDLDKTGVIPDNANIIYLAGPQQDLTDKEKDLLFEYIENGGALSFLIDPCDTKGRFYNIEAVMEKFGLILDYNIVTESNFDNMLQDTDSKQSEYYFRVEYQAGSRYNDEFTQDLTSDIIDQVNAGNFIAGIANTRSLTEIPDFAGGEYTEISSLIKNIQSIDPETKEQVYTTVSKAMGGDEVTAQQADEMLTNYALDFGYYSYNKHTGAKMFTLGTSAVIDDNYANAYTTGTQMLALFSNTWLYDSDVQFDVGNKFNSYDSMTFKSGEEATRVMVIVYVIPLAIAVIGILVWLKRRHS